jgi:hypothetical protein
MTPTRVLINPPNRGGTRHTPHLDYPLDDGEQVEIRVADDAKLDCDVDSRDDTAFLAIGPVLLWLTIDQWRALSEQAPEVIDQWERVHDPDEDPRYVGSGL